MNDMSVPRHAITRSRRETRRRLVKVAAIEHVTPRMRRIHFTSPDLHDFASDSYDDHIKLFLPAPAEPSGDGLVCMRDYTPRAFDPREGTLTIDFALHEAGPATAWALAARLNDQLEIGGPRGSTVVADDFDWYLLIGDETALPAIGRRVETLRAGVPVITLVVTDGADERQTFTARAAWTPLWVTRGSEGGDATRLRDALTAFGPLPPGDGYVWIAGEAHIARTLRAHVTGVLGHPKAWVKAAGYWMTGHANTHETIQD